MTSTRRSRRDWRVILWLSLGSAVVSAYFSYAVSESGEPAWRKALTGVAHSIIIATPILLFEVKGQHLSAMRYLRRQPLLWYFAFRLAFYTAIILGGLVLGRMLVGPQGFRFDHTFRDSVVFAIAMATLTNLAFQVGSLLGFRTLRNLATGRYARPRRERRAFLLIDMKDSTGLAERLGPIRFHALLNDFFRDIADGALECGAEIHKYVGDEAILTWPDGVALRDGDVLDCPFVVRDNIKANAATYREHFGAVPEFRASLHSGEIVAGEIGDIRREIAYVGDTLNVAARLLEAAKEAGHDVLVSEDLLTIATPPAGIVVEKLPMLSVRGRKQPLAIAALSSKDRL